MISVRTTLISLFNVCDISLSLINILLWQRFSSRWAKNCLFIVMHTFVRLLLSLILNFFGEQNINISWEHKVDTWHFQVYFFRKNNFQKTWNSGTREFFIRTHINFVPCLISLNCSESQETLGIATLRSKHVIKNDKKEGWGVAEIHSRLILFFQTWSFFSFFFFAPFISTRTQWRLNGSWMFFVRQLGLVFFKAFF